MANRWHTANRNSPATQARRRKYTSREHRETRARYQQRMDRGETFRCWRPNCGHAINPRHWHLGHDDHNVDFIRGPECPPCNVKAGGRKGNAVQRAARTRPVRRRRLL